MTLNVWDVLGRIDIPIIQKHFVSKESLSALKMYEGDDMSFHHNIMSLISEQFSPSEVLRRKSVRTLLLSMLRQDEATALVKEISPNHKTGNPYSQLFRTRFTKKGEMEYKLFRFFGLQQPRDDSLAELDAVDGALPDMRIHDYQREAISMATQYLSNEDRRCLLHMPTGSGKTLTAMRIISSKFLEHEPTLVLWLAYSEELCEQAIDTFKTVWSKMGDREIPILRFYKQYRSDIVEFTSYDKDGLVVAGLNKINSAEKSSGRLLTTLADRVSLVIMDEAHQAVAPVYRSVLEQILDKRPNSIEFLGLSATPGRADTGSEDPRELPRFFGRRKVTLNFDGGGNPIEHLIKEGYQACPDVKIIRADGKLTEDDLKRISRHKDIPKSVLEKIGRNTRRTIKVVGQVEDLIEYGHKRIIVFAPSVDNSRDISLILSARKHKSFHVDANTLIGDRRGNIGMYRSDADEPIVMCNYGVLTTGFDAPTTSAAVIARPTRSRVLYNQMVGRAMRGPRVGGNEKCEIRVITDFNIPGFTSITDGFMAWEELW